MPEYHRIRLIHGNQIPQPTDAGKGGRIGDELSLSASPTTASSEKLICAKATTLISSHDPSDSPDHGPGPALLKAPGDDRWLLWAWAWEARDDAWAREAGWAGVLTLPREVSLTAEGTIAQRPAREVLALRGARTLHRTGHVTRAEPVELGQVSPAFDLTAALVPDATGTSGLRLITSADGSEYLDIRLDPAAGHLTVDRSHASLDTRARGGSYTLPFPAMQRPGSPVELRVIVDRSIAEIYLADEQVLTLRFYPLGEGPWRLQARTTGTLRGEFAVEAWDLTQAHSLREPTLTGRGWAPTD